MDADRTPFRLSSSHEDDRELLNIPNSEWSMKLKEFQWQANVTYAVAYIKMHFTNLIYEKRKGFHRKIQTTAKVESL